MAQVVEIIPGSILSAWLLIGNERSQGISVFSESFQYTLSEKLFVHQSLLDVECGITLLRSNDAYMRQ